MLLGLFKATALAEYKFIVIKFSLPIRTPLYRPALLPVALAGLSLLLSGCANPDQFDRAGGLERDDYSALRDRGAAPLEDREAPPIPSPQPLMAMPDVPEPAAEKLVTLSVADPVPVRDVLIQLAREAGYNVELDPAVTGTVFFQAIDEPFPLVVRRLCDLAGLYCKVEGRFLRVQPDRPYLVNYAFDNLNLTRRARSEIGIATNVFASVQGEGGSGGSSGGGAGSLGGDAQSSNNSVTLVEGDSSSNLWTEISNAVSAILGVSETTPDNEATGAAVSFSLNRQAGVATVMASSRQHQQLQEFFTQLTASASAQVLIEARIVEVDLSEKFRSGINWQTLMGGATELGANFVAPTEIARNPDGLFSLSVNETDLEGIIELVRGFGATRTLSSPRLTVMNNQTAVLKVARNHVYFTSEVEQTQVTTDTGTVQLANPLISSTPNTVPIGLVMSVQPSIDLANQSVTLNLRPTISRLVDEVRDPSVDLASNQVCADVGFENCQRVSSLIPVIEVREMDSVMRISSGTVAVLGGLMQDRGENEETGLPGLDVLPLVGNLAKSRDNNSSIIELVILLRATILDQVRPDAADVNLYKRYQKDPRPLPVGNP